MPGKKTPKPKSSAGETGLITETTSEGQAPVNRMNPELSTAAAPKLPEEDGGIPEECKMFEALFGDSPPNEQSAENPPHGSIDVDKEDNEDKDNEEEDVFLLPESGNYAIGTSEYFTEKMRFNGLRWRHGVKQRVKKDPTLRDFLLWVNNRPSPMDEATRPLGQMLHDIKSLHGEADQIVDMGDGYVQMPIATFERHVYPSAYLRSYLRAMGEEEDLMGAVESSYLYAFHMQYQQLPAERTALDLQLLRATSLHAGDDIFGQVTDSSEMVSGLSQNVCNTLDKLEEECQLPNFRTMQNWSRQEAEARANNVKKTLAMYRQQAKHDYQLLSATKEKNIYLAKLTGSQAIENLVLNSRILNMVQEKEIRVQSTLGADLKAATARFEQAMKDITTGTVVRLEAQYEQVLQSITPYDTDDAKQLLGKQTELLAALEITNTMLVSENSKLRLHLSFMPIRYRQEIEVMQKTDNQLYREQRRTPKNISPQDSDNHAGKLKLVEAPRAHEMTQRYLHDCEYAGMKEIRTGMREAKKLKKNLYSNIIPFKSDDINAPPLLPRKETATKPDSGKGKAALRASHYNADQGPPTRRKLDDRESREDRAFRNRTPLDYRLFQRQSPPRKAPQNRNVDFFSGTAYPGDPARDRANHSGPMADKDARDKHDDSLRDKSMSSDRSRDSRPREGATERFRPSRNRDPRDVEGQRDRSYSYLQGPRSKGKGAAAKRPDVVFPKFYNTPITILPRANALRHLKLERPLPPPTEAEALSITDFDLADLLRKPSLGQYDRANHVTICGQLREMYLDSMIGIETHVGRYEPDQPSVWVDIFGEVIEEARMDQITIRYYLPPEKDQTVLGNYWWIVRIRPGCGSNKKYEYMINKDYSYKRVAFDFAQMKTLTLYANRWYYEGPFAQTHNSCLYPYYQYCPGLDIDFRRCNINLQINRLQYMEETKEPPKNIQCLQALRREDKKREPHEAVQLLVDTGAIPSSTRQSLEDYLLELQPSYDATEASLKRIPFATARRFLLMHQTRLGALLKAIKYVLNPIVQHGKFVNNLPDPDLNEPEDDEDDDTVDEDDGDQSPLPGDSSTSPKPPIEKSTIQYTQLPLPKNQGRSELNQDRQSGGRGGNHR